MKLSWFSDVAESTVQVRFCNEHLFKRVKLYYFLNGFILLNPFGIYLFGSKSEIEI